MKAEDIDSISVGLMDKQEGFSFDEEIPHKQFADDPTPPHKLYRKGDPDTSRDAARSLNDLTPWSVWSMRRSSHGVRKGVYQIRLEINFPTSLIPL